MPPFPFWLVLLALAHLAGNPADEPLQIVAFRKIERDGMIRSRAETGNDLRIGAGVERRAGNDFLEKLDGDAAGAGERHQQAAWTQELEGKQVDVLVGARRLVDVRNRRRELGRIEHDEIEAARLIAESPQRLEYIAFDPFRLSKPV